MRNLFKRIINLFQKKKEGDISKKKYSELIQIESKLENTFRKFFGVKRVFEIIILDSPLEKKQKAMSYVQDMLLAVEDIKKELKNTKKILNMADLFHKYDLTKHSYNVLIRPVCIESIYRDINNYYNVEVELERRAKLL